MNINRVRVVALATLIVLPLLPVTGQQASATPEDKLNACHGPWFVENRGLYLDVEDSSPNNGARVLSWWWTGNDNQKWVFCDFNRDNRFEEVSPMSNLDKCLDVYEGHKDPGQWIIQWDCKRTKNQEWSFFERPDGFYAIVNENSRLVLDLWGNDSPKQVGQWYFGELNPLQAWNVTSATAAGGLARVTPPQSSHAGWATSGESAPPLNE